VETSVLTKAISLSKDYADMSVQGATVMTSGNNVKIKLSKGLNVVNINASSMFAPNSMIDFVDAVTDDTTILFNVFSGTTLNIGSSINFGNNMQNAKSKMLWNFTDADVLSFNSKFYGSVMAVSASFSTTTDVDGSVIVDEWNNQNISEVHLYPFKGTIPEPTTLILLTAGSLTLLRKRK
jgi:choice-of-anchor A domain-containing protein